LTSFTIPSATYGSIPFAATTSSFGGVCSGLTYDSNSNILINTGYQSFSTNYNGSFSVPLGTVGTYFGFSTDSNYQNYSDLINCSNNNINQGFNWWCPNLSNGIYSFSSPIATLTPYTFTMNSFNSNYPSISLPYTLSFTNSSVTQGAMYCSSGLINGNSSSEITFGITPPSGLAFFNIYSTSGSNEWNTSIISTGGNTFTPRVTSFNGSSILILGNLSPSLGAILNVSGLNASYTYYWTLWQMTDNSQ